MQPSLAAFGEVVLGLEKSDACIGLWGAAWSDPTDAVATTWRRPGTKPAQLQRMAREFPSFAVPRGVRALVLAQVGAGLTILALWGCGGTGVTTDANAGAGGSASGGGGTDGDSSGGAASGGAATGGAASGGAAAGGTSSGGSGTGGVADIVNACPGVPSGPGVYPPCRTQADC